MSVSGSEHIRRIKAQIDEIDPSAVRELAGEGVALIDVRESGESGTAAICPEPSTSRAAISSLASTRRSPTARST